MTFFRPISLAMSFLAGCLLLSARELPGDREATLSIYRPTDAVLDEKDNIWHGLSNPTSLDLFPEAGNGTTQLGGLWEGGDFHRAKDPEEKYALNFHSDSHRRFKALDLYGSFDFNQTWYGNRAWSDLSDPYNNNPYQAGSSIPADYSLQAVDFTVIGTSHLLFGFMRAGIGLDYSTGDYSRKADPRSRNQLMKLSVYPGISFGISGSHLFGLTFRYTFDKEKMLAPTCVQTSAYDTYSYYDMKGLGEYSLASLQRFTRRFMENVYCGSLQYGFVSDRASLGAEISYSRRKDTVEGENRAEPGDYGQSDVEGRINLRLSSAKGFHLITVSGNISRGKANEYLQERETVHNSNGSTTTFWRTVFKSVRYRSNGDSGTLSYEYWNTSRPSRVWSLGAKGGYAGFSDRYILPESIFSTSRLYSGLTFGTDTGFSENSGLKINVTAGYAAPGKCRLETNPGLDTDGKTDIRDNVLVPDNLYYRSAFISAEIDIAYYFRPWRIKNTCFVSACAAAMFPTSVPSGVSGSRIAASIAFGLSL